MLHIMLFACCCCGSFQSEVPSHENILRLRKATAVTESGVNTGVNERRSSEPFYVNVPSVGLKGHVHDESMTGHCKVKSHSVDSIGEEADGDDSLELVITEADNSTQLSDSQKCKCYIV